MRRFLFIAATSFLSLGALFAESASELAERFAVADDRETVVASLVPGTQDYFRYRCLLWQHQGKLAEVDAVAATWAARFGDSPELQQIRLRQALLWFGVDAQRGSERLTQALDLHFSQASQVGAGTVANQSIPLAHQGAAFGSSSI